MSHNINLKGKLHRGTYIIAHVLFKLLSRISLEISNADLYFDEIK